MKLAQILFSQGFGTRRACEGLAAAGLVEIAGRVHDDPFEELEPEGLVLHVEGQAWPWHAVALIAMNKPAGHECSAKPRHHASVYSLLPAPLRRREVQCVGRLDEDCTGLLLFTDDGTLLHRWTSPRHHLPKVYDVSCRHPVGQPDLDRLREGVVLMDDPRPVRALAAEPWSGAAPGLHGIRLTLDEGKYHQVKRMLAAVGNRVEALHRSRFGALELAPDLAPGRWTWLAGPSAVTG